jgi:hypothetical protein
MKIKSILLTLALLSSQASAATLISSTADTGIVESDGTTALTNGALRFGYFATGFDFTANANNMTALENAFIQVAAYTGAISFSGFDGFYDYNTTYSTTGSFEGVPFDSSTGATTNVLGDIAGERVYLWVLNAATSGAATGHAIFSSNAVWTDGDTAFNNDSLFTFDSGTPGLTAHIGTLNGGSDIGGGNPAHQLAAIPEPSRALLAFAGLFGLVMRRRRA